jgi:hypothetical protein
MGQVTTRLRDSNRAAFAPIVGGQVNITFRDRLMHDHDAVDGAIVFDILKRKQPDIKGATIGSLAQSN